MAKQGCTKRKVPDHEALDILDHDPFVFLVGEVWFVSGDLSIAQLQPIPIDRELVGRLHGEARYLTGALKQVQLTTTLRFALAVVQVPVVAGVFLGKVFAHAACHPSPRTTLRQRPMQALRDRPSAFATSPKLLPSAMMPAI